MPGNTTENTTVKRRLFFFCANYRISLKLRHLWGFGDHHAGRSVMSTGDSGSLAKQPADNTKSPTPANDGDVLTPRD